MARRIQVAATSNRRRGAVDNAFKISINTENLGGTGSATKTFVLPAYGGPFDVTDWGDGSSDLAVSGSQTHVYSATGIYTITINKITNNFRPCYFNDGGDELKIIDIENWGNIRWDSGYGVFRGCANLDISATDNPDFSASTNMYTLFYNCSSITKHCKYDAPLAASWAYAFYNNSSLTSMPISDTSGGTDFGNWMRLCTSLTSVPAFDVSSGVEFGNAWRECDKVTSFSSELDFSSADQFDYGFYKVESCTSYPSEWDFSNVTNARGIFRNNFAVTSFPSEWNFDNVNALGGREMFRECTSLTSLPAYSFNGVTNFQYMLYGNQAMVNIPNFPDSAIVTNFDGAFRWMGTVGMPTTLDMSGMDNGNLCFYLTTIPDAAYQLLIIDLEANNDSEDVVFYGGYASLDGDVTSIAARTALVDDKGWTITDGDGTHAP